MNKIKILSIPTSVYITQHASKMYNCTIGRVNTVVRRYNSLRQYRYFIMFILIVRLIVLEYKYFYMYNISNYTNMYSVFRQKAGVLYSIFCKCIILN